MTTSPNPPLRIVILGAGAVGGYFGALLAHAGHDVVFAVRGATLQAMRARGLRLEGPRGNWHIASVHATDAPGDALDADVVLSCVKLYDAESSARQWAPALESARRVISLQNGIDGAARIRLGAPAAHVLAGMAFVAGRLVAPGVIHYLSDMSSFTCGGPGATGDAALLDFARACNEAVQLSPLSVRVVEDIASAQWTKFVGLATNAAMTCLTRQPAGVVYHDDDLLALARQSIDEVIAVGRAAGAVLPDTLAADTLAWLQGFPPGLVASMHHDLMAGKPLELDGISGYLVRSGRALGVPTPFHAIVWACLKPYLNGTPAGKTA